MWEQIGNRMAELEGKLNNQESAVDRQSFTVKKLRQQVTRRVAWREGLVRVKQKDILPLKNILLDENLLDLS
jgi:hypothetical protein